MKKEDIEKYIANLSPELQEKARACKNMEELKKLIAENDIELPEDVLEAVSGGACECSSSVYNTGDLVVCVKCGDCNGPLYYWDMLHRDWPNYDIIRMYCNNPKCQSYKNGLWCASCDSDQELPFANVYKWYEGIFE